MSDRDFMGFKIHYHTGLYFPHTVLFSKEDLKITVSMVTAVLDYILSIIAPKNPVIQKYKKAKEVFLGMKMILENKQPFKITKEDVQTAIDVLEEVTNRNAQTDAEREQNAQYACICKLLVETL